MPWIIGGAIAVCGVLGLLVAISQSQPSKRRVSQQKRTNSRHPKRVAPKKVKPDLEPLPEVLPEPKSGKVRLDKSDREEVETMARELAANWMKSYTRKVGGLLTRQQIADLTEKRVEFYRPFARLLRRIYKIQHELGASEQDGRDVAGWLHRVQGPAADQYPDDAIRDLFRRAMSTNGGIRDGLRR